MVTLSKNYGLCSLLNLSISGIFVIINLCLVIFFSVGSVLDDGVEQLKEMIGKSEDKLIKIMNINNIIEKSRFFSTFSFILILVDVVLRISQLFLLCCFIRYTKSKKLNGIVLFLSFGITCLYFIFLLSSYSQFFNLFKYVISEFNSSDYYISRFLNDVTRERNINLVAIISSLVTVPFYIVSFIIEFCYDGMSILEVSEFKVVGEADELSEIKEGN